MKLPMPEKPDIIDAHHHIWRQADQPWLNGPMVPRRLRALPGDPARLSDRRISRGHQKLRRRRLGLCADQLGADAARSRKSPGCRRRPTRTAFRTPSSASPISPPPRSPRILDAMQNYSRLKGVRQQVHWHDNPQYRFAPRPNVIADEGMAARARAARLARACCSSCKSSPRKWQRARRLRGPFRIRPSSSNTPACWKT